MNPADIQFFDKNTKNQLTGIGVALIAAFFIPLYFFGGLVWPNIESLAEDRIDFGDKLLMIYPLLAGIGILIVSNKKRNLVSTILLILIAVFALLLYGDSDLVKMFSKNRGGSKLFSSGFISFLGLSSFLLILGGAYAAGYLKQKKIGTYVTISGVGIFLISLLVKGEMSRSIPLIDSFRMMISPNDYYRMYSVSSSEKVFIILLGSVFLISLLLKIFASYSAYLMLREGTNYLESRNKVLKYWIWSILVPIIALLVGTLYFAADRGSAAELVGVALLIIKMLCWVGGVLFLLPLALSELLLLIDSGANLNVSGPVLDKGKKLVKDVKDKLANMNIPSVQKYINPGSKDKAIPSEPPAAENTVDKLTSLKNMFEEGVINQEEYDALRKEVLAKM